MRQNLFDELVNFCNRSCVADIHVYSIQSIGTVSLQLLFSLRRHVSSNHVTSFGIQPACKGVTETRICSSHEHVPSAATDRWLPVQDIDESVGKIGRKRR